jgi:glycosyltransferase involved in cell wall biosynthesis
VRVLVFHGYLLRGTGSNVYNANLAAALVRLGHDVHLLCQERHAAELPFVGALGSWDHGELALERLRPEGCTVYRPNIGGLLPVYVADRYEGFEARPFPELDDAQLDAYVRANVDAVAEVAQRARPDVALANHLVMGPAILARGLSAARVPYAVKVHGSALEYTVKPYPRFLPYAREGIAAANGVLVGSRHTAESLWRALADPSLPAKTRLGPPGVELSRFHPAERSTVQARLRSRSRASSSGLRASSSGAPAQSAFSRDNEQTARALAALSAQAPGDPLVAFVGKLIVSKGIDLLLVAWPLVLAAVPSAHLAVVGFGEYRAAAHELAEALSAGDLASVRSLAARGRAAEGGPASQLRYVSSFLQSLAAEGEERRYVAAAAGLSERVIFTGRLEHDELADLLPLCEAIVVPSTFPEAFGMVAVEAAACGALPISAGHSGLVEVSRTLAAQLPEPVRECLSFELGPDAVRAIANRTISWLRAPPRLREETRNALARAAAARYSWEGVARGVIAAAQGELDALPAPQ